MTKKFLILLTSLLFLSNCMTPTKVEENICQEPSLSLEEKAKLISESEKLLNEKYRGNNIKLQNAYTLCQFSKTKDFELNTSYNDNNSKELQKLKLSLVKNDKNILELKTNNYPATSKYKENETDFIKELEAIKISISCFCVENPEILITPSTITYSKKTASDEKIISVKENTFDTKKWDEIKTIIESTDFSQFPSSLSYYNSYEISDGTFYNIEMQTKDKKKEISYNRTIDEVYTQAKKIELALSNIYNNILTN